MSEDDATEKVFTLNDVVGVYNFVDNLQEEAATQKRGRWGKEGCCTYDKGYKTQPVYACKTCTTKEGREFGFCFGCSLHCHLDKEHEVIELFDKRNFCCDCPTSRSGCSCFLHEKVQVENKKNTYNHNYKGLYCFCDGTYEENQTMLQCVMCQDWFHDFCIQKEYITPLPLDDDTDYVCRNCVKKYQFFISKYGHLKHTEVAPILPENAGETAAVTNEVKTDTSEAASETGQLACLIEGKSNGEVEDIFFVPEWREKLCRFEEDPESEEEDDGDEEYEHVGLEGQQLPALRLVEQMHVQHGMTELGTKLSSYFQTLTNGNPDRVIDKRDIEAFFQGLKDEAEAERNAKRRKTEY